jgi:hypothetical protein
VQILRSERLCLQSPDWFVPTILVRVRSRAVSDGAVDGGAVSDDEAAVDGGGGFAAEASCAMSGVELLARLDDGTLDVNVINAASTRSTDGLLCDALRSSVRASAVDPCFWLSYVRVATSMASARLSGVAVENMIIGGVTIATAPPPPTRCLLERARALAFPNDDERSTVEATAAPPL